LCSNKIQAISEAAEFQIRFQSTLLFWVGRLFPCSFGVSADPLVYSLFTDELRISFEAYPEVPQFTPNVCWWFEHESWE